MNEFVEDPVCHMKVPTTSFAAEFAGAHYAFCSAQCRARFLASPHLYVGFPGRPAPAQEGKKVIKRHRLLLSAPLDTTQAEQVKSALLEMMGMHEVSVEGKKIEIQYDLIQVTAEQIANKLASIGAELGEGLIISNWRLSIIWKKLRLTASKLKKEKGFTIPFDRRYHRAVLKLRTEVAPGAAGGAGSD